MPLSEQEWVDAAEAFITRNRLRYIVQSTESGLVHTKEPVMPFLVAFLADVAGIESQKRAEGREV